MMVKSLEAMERIVANSNDLIWDGYDVLKIKKSPAAIFYSDGKRIHGEWYRTKRFILGRHGWKIPDYLIKGTRGFKA